MDDVTPGGRASRWCVAIAYATGLGVIVAGYWLFNAPSLRALVVTLFCLLLFGSALRMVDAVLDSPPLGPRARSKRSWRSLFRLSQISSAPVSTLTAMAGAYFASGSAGAAFAFTLGLHIDAGGAATQLTAALVTIPLYRASHAYLDC